MIAARIIPCLQLIDDALVKCVKFKNPSYIGDPINTVRIFNELEVDELCFLDIRATKEKRAPNLQILRDIANECFMPLSYGGGVKDATTALNILSIGFEKIVFNTALFEHPEVITELAKVAGNQSVIASIDVKKNLWGKYEVYSHDGNKKQKLSAVECAKRAENLGAGELLITSMNNEGSWQGFDIDLCKMINESVSIPVIANAGAGNINHIGEVISQANVSGVALGSMVVYQKQGMGVLVNFPDKSLLKEKLKTF